jgi:hypothetical protein
MKHDAYNWAILLDPALLAHVDGPVSSEVDDLIDLASSGNVRLFLPSSAKCSINAINWPVKTKQRIARIPFAVEIPKFLVNPKDELNRRLCCVISKSHETSTSRQEVLYLIEAAVTCDYIVLETGSICLKNRPEILKLLPNLKVMSAQELLQHFHHHRLRARDQ